MELQMLLFAGGTPAKVENNKEEWNGSIGQQALLVVLDMDKVHGVV